MEWVIRFIPNSALAERLLGAALVEWYRDERILRLFHERIPQRGKSVWC